MVALAPVRVSPICRTPAVIRPNSAGESSTVLLAASVVEPRSKAPVLVQIGDVRAAPASRVPTTAILFAVMDRVPSLVSSALPLAIVKVPPSVLGAVNRSGAAPPKPKVTPGARRQPQTNSCRRDFVGNHG